MTHCHSPSMHHCTRANPPSNSSSKQRRGKSQSRSPCAGHRCSMQTHRNGTSCCSGNHSKPPLLDYQKTGLLLPTVRLRCTFWLTYTQSPLWLSSYSGETMKGEPPTRSRCVDLRRQSDWRECSKRRCSPALKPRLHQCSQQLRSHSFPV